MHERDYDYGLLIELAEEREAGAKVASGVGDTTGVALPAGCVEHAVITTHSARRLAAQLLLAADLHDTIYEKGMQARELEIRRLRTTLSDTYNFLLDLGDIHEILGSGPRYIKHMKYLAAQLGRDYPEWRRIRWPKHSVSLLVITKDTRVHCVRAAIRDQRRVL